jgi:hypothetical protein
MDIRVECKKKKVAIVYRGHFYREDPKILRLGKPDVNSNFFLNYENNKQVLFNNFNEPDIFFHTYCAGKEKNEKLVEYLKPKKYMIERFKPRRYDLTNSIIKGAKLYNADDYDLIINTRFDLIYKNHIWRFDLQFDKFNFLYPEPYKFWSKNKAVCDLMYVYHAKYNEAFIDAIPDARNRFASHKPKEYKRKKRAALHFLYESLNIADDEKNFLIKKHFHSNTSIRVARKNPFVLINRNK